MRLTKNRFYSIRDPWSKHLFQNKDYSRRFYKRSNNSNHEAYVEIFSTYQLIYCETIVTLRGRSRIFLFDAEFIYETQFDRTTNKQMYTYTHWLNDQLK
jgi:hypothetical protein